jgi:hypothetical protein
MCDSTLQCSKNLEEETVLKIGRSPHFNVRQYVSKLDQFIYMLELNHILFPAKTGMNVKRDFRIALKYTKAAVNNLRSKLFCLSNSNKLSPLKLASMRCKRKKRGIDLSFPKTIGPSRFVTNSETCHNKSDLINNQDIVEIDLEKDVEIIDISEDQNEIRDAAISLIELRDSGHKNIVNMQVDKPISPIKNTQELHLNMSKCNKVSVKYGQKLHTPMDISVPSVKSIQVIDLKPFLIPAEGIKAISNVVKIGNTTYTIEEANYEVVQQESTTGNYVMNMS